MPESGPNPGSSDLITLFLLSPVRNAFVSHHLQKSVHPYEADLELQHCPIRAGSFTLFPDSEFKWENRHR